MGGWLIIWVGLILAGLAAGGFISVPKGENQVVIRTSILLVVTCCYLMQVHTPSSAYVRKGRSKLTGVVMPTLLQVGHYLPGPTQSSHSAKTIGSTPAAFGLRHAPFPTVFHLHRIINLNLGHGQ